jgi:DNA-binding Lrp family transcriptional regulator
MKSKENIKKLLDKYEANEGDIDADNHKEEPEIQESKQELKLFESKTDKEEKVIRLDLKDRRLLYELDKNCRQSNSEIGKKIRLNKNTVNYNVKRLEQEGAILGYYTVIDNSKLGYFSFRVYANFFNTKPEQENELINWLINNNRIGVVARIESIYDFVVMMWVKDVYEFDKFWLEFKKKFRAYFWNERVDVFTSVYHFKRKYLLEEDMFESYEFIGENKKAEHDELDIKILRLLSKNARMPLIEISSKLKIPERTVAFRIKRMEKNKIIQGYRVNIDLEKIGYEYYKINMVLNDFQDYDRLFEFSSNHPNIVYFDRTITDLDFEIDVEVKNRHELLKLLEQIKANFSIRSTEILSLKHYYKLELIP